MLRKYCFMIFLIFFFCCHGIRVYVVTKGLNMDWLLKSNRSHIKLEQLASFFMFFKKKIELENFT
jgi:hypothetical protein